MSSQWWYAKPDFSDNNFSKLALPTDVHFSDDQRFFRDAQKLRITVEGAWVADDMDKGFRRDNDLVIATKFRIGKKPPVSKLHYYKRNCPAEHWENVVFHPEVYATEDFRESTGEIGLQLFVYDEDGLRPSEQEKMASAITAGTSAAAIAFPAIAPYAGLASGIINSLTTVVSKLDEHDQIVNAKIKLAVNRPDNQGFDHLQPGFLICFNGAVSASNLVLGEDKKLYYKDGSKYKHYQHRSYAVLRVDRAGTMAPDFERNQKLATLLTEIENGKNGGAKSALNFLEETMESYQNFKRLQRYTELKTKQSKSDEETQLQSELESDPALAPFIQSS